MNKGKSNINYSSLNNSKESASLMKSYISCNATLHSDEGEYVNNGKRHSSGGHGQTSLDYFEKKKIEYIINKEYNNGVRVGNIPWSKQPLSREGNNHTWFPQNWTIADIREAGEAISNKYRNQKIKDGEKRSIIHKGVKVVAIYNRGEVSTVFPDKHQRGGIKYDK